MRKLSRHSRRMHSVLGGVFASSRVVQKRFGHLLCRANASRVRPRQSLLLGLAVWSVLLASFAPTFTQLIERGRAIEICTSAGVRAFLPNSDETVALGDKDKHRSAITSCPYCLPGSHHFALPAFASERGLTEFRAEHIASAQWESRSFPNVIILAPAPRAPPAS